MVIVDVLSFTTCVSTAVNRGATVIPCGWEEDPEALARAHEARIAAPRPMPPRDGVFSLSPVSLMALAQGEKLVLPSPNGSTTTRMVRHAPAVFAGCLRNAAATADAAYAAARELGCDIAVVACGERVHATGEWRFALEDHLGAGAILARLPGPLHGTAARWAAAFRSAETTLEATVAACISGVELIERGYADDVRHAAALDADARPVRLAEERYVCA